MTHAFRSPSRDPGTAGHTVLEILTAALRAADPGTAVRAHLALDDASLRISDTVLPLDSLDRIYLVGAGKAARGMIYAAESILADRVTSGVAVTTYGTAAPTELRRTTVYEAGHPLPDPAGLMATRHIARLLDRTTPRDLVIVLLSGGASALLEMPAARIPLVDIQSATSMLLASGAAIDEVNAVRKHISAVKGGGLARLAAPARVAALVLSDVVGSPIDVIASGPTVPDSSTFADAGRVLSRYALWGTMPASIGDHLRAGMAGHVPETARPDDPVFERVTTTIVGDNAGAAAAAVAAAVERGFNAVVLTTYLEGEARDAGRIAAAMGKEIAARGGYVAAPACLVMGGETTVTLQRLGGTGGRNQELALSAALALDGWADVTLAAMDTDGVDGATEAAGALVDGTTAARAREAGLDPVGALDRHDSGPFFAALGDALLTGPTGTNVNDLIVLLVGAAG